MKRDYIIDSDRLNDELEYIGETGTMTVRGNGDVYAKREENAQELYVGYVVDVEAARNQIDEYFNR